MNRPRIPCRLRALPLFFLLAIAPLYAGEGVVYDFELTDHEKSPPEIESMQMAVAGQHLKITGASGGSGSEDDMIFDGELREIVFVNHREKAYFVMDRDSVGQMAGEINDAMSQMQAEMEEMLKSVPADQRPAIEAMMKRQMPAVQQPAARPQTELKNTGERAKKNGYPCVRYEVWKGGRKISELWVTDWSNIEGGKDVAGVFEEMAAFFHDMMDAMPQMGGDADLDDNLFGFTKDLDGLPVVTREFGADGSLEGEMALNSVRRESFGDDDFGPPENYTRREMFGER